MDEVTQQNAALVEQAAAAAAVAAGPGGNLAQVVSVFKLDDSQSAAPMAIASLLNGGKSLPAMPAMRPQKKSAQPKIAAPASQRRPIAAKPVADDGWEEF